MEIINFRITSDYGFDVRFKNNLVNKASKFESEIKIISGKMSLNLKSIMGVMSLILKYGDHFSLTAEGNDEKEAIDFISSFVFENKVAKEI